MRTGIILGILLLILAAGCISPEVQTGVPQQYELPGLNNTTIYYLNISFIQVVDSVTNATSVQFFLGDSGEMDFRNPVAVDYSGKNVTFNASRGAIFGKSYARFDFNSPFSGFVAYTQSDGQDFTRTLTENKSIRVVLPAGYTTGSRFLGIAQPEPDSIAFDSSGREVLIWKNPYPADKLISVKYYKTSALKALFYLFISLLIAAFIIFSYYKLSIRALKKKRDLIEKGVKK